MNDAKFRALLEAAIEAASRGRGQGATFRVSLPSRVARDRRRRKRAAPDVTALAGATVVVLDDHEDERLLLAAIFTHAGARVRTASTVAEALAAMSASRPQLMVSDLSMPIEDGYALIRRMRETPGLRRVPALAVTAHARPEDRDAALAAGFNGYVSKPLDRALLLARAAAVVTSAARKSKIDSV